ncbi:MAG: hypothetical protein ACLRXQ_07390 [Phascolarctobacterium faecium]
MRSVLQSAVLCAGRENYELTLAKTAAVSKADYIFVTECGLAKVQAAGAALRDPHKSATVLTTADLQAGKRSDRGPGIGLSRKSLCARTAGGWGNVMSRNMSIRWALIFLLDQRGCLMAYHVNKNRKQVNRWLMGSFARKQ